MIRRIAAATILLGICHLSGYGQQHAPGNPQSGILRRDSLAASSNVILGSIMEQTPPKPENIRTITPGRASGFKGNVNVLAGGLISEDFTLKSIQDIYYASANSYYAGAAVEIVLFGADYFSFDFGNELRYQRLKGDIRSLYFSDESRYRCGYAVWMPYIQMRAAFFYLRYGTEHQWLTDFHLDDRSTVMGMNRDWMSSHRVFRRLEFGVDYNRWRLGFFYTFYKKRQGNLFDLRQVAYYKRATYSAEADMGTITGLYLSLKIWRNGY